MYSWLPSGHDTVKGLPKEKPRTSGKLQGPLLPPTSLAAVPLPYPNRVSFRLFRSRMRAKAAAVIRAVSTPRTTGTQDVRLWGGPCLPVTGKGNVMSQADTKMSFYNFARMPTSPSLAKRFPKPSRVSNQKDLKDPRVCT